MHFFQSTCFIPFLRQPASTGLLRCEGSLHLTQACVILSFSLDLAHRKRTIDTVQQLNTPKPALEIGTMIQLHLVRDFGLQSTIKFIRPPIFPQGYTTVITVSNLKKQVNFFLTVTCWQSR